LFCYGCFNCSFGFAIWTVGDCVVEFMFGFRLRRLGFRFGYCFWYLWWLVWFWDSNFMWCGFGVTICVLDYGLVDLVMCLWMWQCFDAIWFFAASWSFRSWPYLWWVGQFENWLWWFYVHVILCVVFVCDDAGLLLMVFHTLAPLILIQSPTLKAIAKPKKGNPV